MGVADVTSSDAVDAAIDEFEELGEGAFLNKYGFGPARDYAVLRDGKQYPSKAILGAAHGHQHPEKGALEASSFNGGTQTTSRLASLGFAIERLTRPENPEGADPSVWVVRAGRKGEAEQLCLEKGLCGVGWVELPDLSTLSPEDINAKIDDVYGGDPEGRIRTHKLQVGDFMSMARGDLVLMPLKTREGKIAVGRISGPYQHRTDLTRVTNHVRPTHWFAEVDREQFGALRKWLNRPLTVGRIPVEADLILDSVETGEPVDIRVDSGPRTWAAVLDEVLDALGAESAQEHGGAAQILSEGSEAALKPLLKADYPMKYGAGIGTPADVPWIAVYPAGSPASAQSGFYVVYLFAADGSAVFLSLNQGTENVRGGLSVLRKRASDLRAAAGLDSAGDDIDLAKAGGRPAKYEAANAFAIRYEAGAIPDDDELKSDLEQLTDAMDVAAAAGLDFDQELEPIHLIFKWSADIETQTVALHSAVADEKGSVWWGKFGTGNNPIGQGNRKQIEEQLARGMPTYAFLYGGGQAFRTQLRELTVDPAAVDEARMTGYYAKEDCNMFVRLSDFEELPEGWLLGHLVLASDPDPSKMQGALSNQTTPLFAHERFVPLEQPPMKQKLDKDWLVKETLWAEKDLDELLDAVKDRGQVILAGPPGTGKTWIAERLARYLTEDQTLRVRKVQLHPSYGYEEFVEGLRPVAEDGTITFERRDGVILDMAQAMEGTEEPYVLIVDELNRANIPRVFGELFYLLEYRETSIDLQFSKGFELPKNLKIIATMNTADRSTRSIDIALRRRFEIFECPADPLVLTRYYEDESRASAVSNLIDGFQALNADLIEQLDRHHTIGQSFFMAETFTPADLRRAWHRQILPLIEDYFFDQQDLVDQFTQEKYWPGS